MKLSKTYQKFGLILFTYHWLLCGSVFASLDETLLKELVEISSDSHDAKGVNRVQDRIEKELKKLGFETRRIAPPTDHKETGELLEGILSGRSKQTITLVTHADTVFSKKSGFTHYRKDSNGQKAVGPGVIDDKGGIVIALKAIENLLKRNATLNYSIRFISSPNEEVGSTGFNDFFREVGKQSIAVLGFEPALEGGHIIESRRGDRWYEVKVEGKEGHAGRSHAQSVNACYDLAKKLTQIQELTRYEDDVTVSVGHFSGGKDKFNVVCGAAEAKVDARFATLKSRDQLHQKIMQILNTSYAMTQDQKLKSKTKVTLADDCPPFSKTPQSKPFIEFIIKEIETLENRTIKSKKSGGAADSNYLSREGLIVIDGLGAVGGKMHTQDETIELSSLETRSQAVAKLLHRLDQI